MSTGGYITYLVMVVFWVLGIAVAKGFWLTAFTVFVPPAAWVLFAQYVLERLA